MTKRDEEKVMKYLKSEGKPQGIWDAAKGTNMSYPRAYGTIYCLLEKGEVVLVETHEPNYKRLFRPT